MFVCLTISVGTKRGKRSIGSISSSPLAAAVRESTCQQCWWQVVHVSPLFQQSSSIYFSIPSIFWTPRKVDSWSLIIFWTNCYNIVIFWNQMLTILYNIWIVWTINLVSFVFGFLKLFDYLSWIMGLFFGVVIALWTLNTGTRVVLGSVLIFCISMKFERNRWR